MKHMRKLVTLVVVLAMVMAFMVPTAMAAAEDLDSNNAKYTIKIADGVKDQTYTAYKVFDVTLATETGNDTDAGFAYTISTNSQWWTLLRGTKNSQTGVYTNSTYGLTFTPSASDNTVYVITSTMNETQAAALAAYLRTNISNKTTAGSVVYSNSNTTIDVTASGMGYYFVDTTVGTLCSLDTTNQDVTINEKNTAPTMNSKTVIGNAVCIGVEKIFTIEFTAGKGAENYILHDSMEAGFNAASDFGVTYKDGQDEAVAADTSTYTVVTENITDGCSFHIEFADHAMLAGRKVTVTYKTSLNANAEIFDGNISGQTVNQNTAWLSYGENKNLTTPQKSAFLYTYAFAFNKTDGEGNPLSGAKFTLTEWNGDSFNPVYFTKDANSAVYTYAGNVAAEGLTSEVVTPDNGVIILKGFTDAYYRVLETEAPDGYNILATTTDIRPSINWTSAPTTNHYISYENNVATEVENSTGLNTKEVSTGNTPTLMLNIINLTGTELPSTGGIGTTIFYILGGLMVVGAAVVLVTNKRMRGQM